MSRTPAPLRPLTCEALDQLMLRYAGRYLTTQARLVRYLQRKVAERGGPDDAAAIIEVVVQKAVDLGFVDDRAFAAARGAEHQRRGFGPARLTAALRYAGVGEDDAGNAIDEAHDGAWEAALKFARRRRIGPFAVGQQGPIERRRAYGALVRAGHSATIACRILALPADEAQD